MDDTLDRRAWLTRFGGAAVAASVALAGCPSPGEEGGEEGEGDGGGEDGDGGEGEGGDGEGGDGEGEGGDGEDEGN